MIDIIEYKPVNMSVNKKKEEYVLSPDKKAAMVGRINRSLIK